MQLKQFLLSFVYPRRATCMGCGSMIGCDEDDLCDKCREFLAREWIGPRPVPKEIGVDGMAFACPYRGPGGSLVRMLKYSSVRVIADDMSTALAQAAEQMRIARLDCVTFVPMHPKRRRVRGFNHSELLACGVAERIGVPCEALLERTRNARQQARLTRERREENLREGFRACRDLNGMNILLIDDVMTTGATAKHCAAALRKGGAAQIYFAAYALGEGKHR